MNQVDGPLLGLSILVTRPQELAEPLIDAIHEAGAHAISWPALKLEVSHTDRATAAITRLLNADCLIFSSQPAVSFALQLLGEKRIPVSTRLIAVGPSTAARLTDAGYCAQHPAVGTGSEAVLALVGASLNLHSQVGIVCAPGGRRLMAHELTEAGADVSMVETYTTAPPELIESSLTAVRRAASRMWITATSARILENIKLVLAPNVTENLLQRPTVVPAVRLQRAARELGYEHVFTAPGPLPEQIIEGLVAARQAFRGIT